jgi:hypothetical protein
MISVPRASLALIKDPAVRRVFERMSSPGGGAAPVPAGLILQSFFINLDPVVPIILTGPTVSTLIPGASQAITTVANSKLRVTVMHGIFLSAAVGGVPAQLGIEIKIDGSPVAINFTPTLASGAADDTSGSVMFQSTPVAGPHTVEIARTLLNGANVATIGQNLPLQLLVEEISG